MAHIKDIKFEGRKSSLWIDFLSKRYLSSFHLVSLQEGKFQGWEVNSWVVNAYAGAIWLTCNSQEGLGTWLKLR